MERRRSEKEQLVAEGPAETAARRSRRVGAAASARRSRLRGKEAPFSAAIWATRHFWSLFDPPSEDVGSAFFSRTESRRFVSSGPTGCPAQLAAQMAAQLFANSRTSESGGSPLFFFLKCENLYPRNFVKLDFIKSSKKVVRKYSIVPRTNLSWTSPISITDLR